MDTQPFYQILAGTANGDNTEFTVISPEKPDNALTVEMREAFYQPQCRKFCGVRTTNDKDVLCLQNQDSATVSALFSLSTQRISHPVLSPDGQKIAFLAHDRESDTVILRVIMREEFGWFPMAFIKLPAIASPICFCTNDTLMFTAANKMLTAVLLGKRPRTAPFRPDAFIPAYFAATQLTAYTQQGKLFLTGRFAADFDCADVTATAFANKGKHMLYAANGKIFVYDVAEKAVCCTIETKKRITCLSEY